MPRCSIGSDLSRIPINWEIQSTPDTSGQAGFAVPAQLQTAPTEDGKIRAINPVGAGSNRTASAQLQILVTIYAVPSIHENRDRIARTKQGGYIF